MINKFIPILLLLASGTLAVAGVDEKVQFFHGNIVKQIQNHGLSGPIALEAAQWAQLRTIHEDGPDRKHNESMNGMSWRGDIWPGN